MESSTRTDASFVYYVPIPHSIQTFLLIFAGILLTIFFGIPLHQFGLMGTVQSFSTNLGLWLIMATMFMPLLAWFVCLAYPPKSWLARLEFGRNCIRLVPKPPLRWIGEPTKEIAIDPLSDTLFLCAGGVDRSPYGFRVIVRGPNHHNQELPVKSGARLTALQAKALSDGAAAAAGVHLQLINREFDGTGSPRDVPWTPAQRSNLLRGFGKAALSTSPFISGIAVAALRASWLAAASTGLAIWLIQSVFLYIYARFSREQRKFPTLLWLSTLITFSACYAATVAFVSYLFGSQ